MRFKDVNESYSVPEPKSVQSGLFQVKEELLPKIRSLTNVLDNAISAKNERVDEDRALQAIELLNKCLEMIRARL